MSLVKCNDKLEHLLRCQLNFLFASTLTVVVAVVVGLGVVVVFVGAGVVVVVVGVAVKRVVEGAGVVVVNTFGTLLAAFACV